MFHAVVPSSQAALTEIEKLPAAGDGAFVVVGSGPIGEKAEQLLLKRDAILEAGFKLNNRVVLSEEFVHRLLIENGYEAGINSVIPDPGVLATLRFDPETEALFERATRAAIDPTGEWAELLVRSSARGDARGTGIYRSHHEAFHPSVGVLADAVRAVIGGYFSSNAVAFRRDAQLESGFAIIIEKAHREPSNPDQSMELSGYGYTSSDTGGPFVYVVP